MKILDIFRRKPEPEPEAQDDMRLAEINRERRALQSITRDVSDLRLSLIRSDMRRRLTVDYNAAMADLSEAKRRHQPTAEIQARVNRLNAELLAIDLEANRDA